MHLPVVEGKLAVETTILSALEDGVMKRTRLESDRWFDVLLETETAQAAVMTLAPGQSTGSAENAHERSDQWLYVVSGSGRATVEETPMGLEAGDLVCIEAGETHEIENTGSEPLETLNLYLPPAY